MTGRLIRDIFFLIINYNRLIIVTITKLAAFLLVWLLPTCNHPHQLAP